VSAHGKNLSELTTIVERARRRILRANAIPSSGISLGDPLPYAGGMVWIRAKLDRSSGGIRLECTYKRPGVPSVARQKTILATQFTGGIFEELVLKLLEETMRKFVRERSPEGLKIAAAFDRAAPEVSVDRAVLKMNILSALGPDRGISDYSVSVHGIRAKIGPTVASVQLLVALLGELKRAGSVVSHVDTHSRQRMWSLPPAADGNEHAGVDPDCSTCATGALVLAELPALVALARSIMDGVPATKAFELAEGVIKLGEAVHGACPGTPRTV
jgi:hypothetical protein